MLRDAGGIYPLRLAEQRVMMMALCSLARNWTPSSERTTGRETREEGPAVAPMKPTKLSVAKIWMS